MVNFPTAYSLYNRSDYKRCVCDSWFMDEENCVLGNKAKKDVLKTHDGESKKSSKDFDEREMSEDDQMGEHGRDDEDRERPSYARSA